MRNMGECKWNETKKPGSEFQLQENVEFLLKVTKRGYQRKATFCEEGNGNLIGETTRDNLKKCQTSVHSDEAGWGRNAVGRNWKNNW